MTAVDTNVFSVLLSGGRDGQQATALLDAARKQGGLVIYPVVYAEMIANRNSVKASIDELLQEAHVQVEYHLFPQVWREAGARFGRYAARRLLADFVVGAHALLHANRLLTFDVRGYCANFPELALMSP